MNNDKKNVLKLLFSECTSKYYSLNSRIFSIDIIEADCIILNILDNILYKCSLNIGKKIE